MDVLKCCGLAFLALALTAQSSISRAQDAIDVGSNRILPSPSVERTDGSMTVRMILHRGDGRYEQLLGRSSFRDVAEEFIYEFTLLSSARSLRAKRSGNFGGPGDFSVMGETSIPEDPNAPVGPGYVGIPAVGTVSCGLVEYNGHFFTARIEYTYEFRYTRDTNRDGKMDSDPKWVRTGASWREIQQDTAAVCE